MFGAVVAISRLHSRVNLNGFTVAKIFKECFSKKITQLRLGQLSVPVRNFTSSRTFVSNKTCRKDIYSRNYISQQIIAARSYILQRFRSTIATINPSANPLRVNLKVTNNVMLYRFERPYLYKGGLVFAIVSLLGCLAMVDNIYYVLCRGLWDEDKPWMTRLKEHYMPLFLLGTLFVAGPVICYIVWYVTVRSIKYLILRKGGNEVTIVTYHPFKGEKTFTVPIEDISCRVERNYNKGYASIKIKNWKYHYMLDKGGHFVNPDLFDCSVGVKRFD